MSTQNQIDVKVGAREVIAFSAVKLKRQWGEDMAGVGLISPDYIHEIGAEERSEKVVNMTKDLIAHSESVSKLRQDTLGTESMIHDPISTARLILKMASISYATADRGWVEIVGGFVDLFDTVYGPDIEKGWDRYSDDETEICREIQKVTSEILDAAKEIDLSDDWMEGLDGFEDDDEGTFGLQLLEAMGAFDEAEA